MNSLQQFDLERKGEVITMIFPQPQRHVVNAYRKGPRRSYQVLEPKYVAPLVINISKQTARELCYAMKAIAIGTAVIQANDDWHIAFTGVAS